MSLYTQVQRLELDNHHGIVLIRGKTHEGDPIYAYVKVTREDIDELVRAYETGREVDYSHFHGILKHDWGEEPPENVQKLMERQYEFSHSGA